MAYGTIDDVFKRYKPIRTAVGANSFEVTSEDVSSIFIADAESFVDAYVGVKYSTPVNPVPALITMVTCDIAIFNILAEKHVQVPDAMQARYDRSLALLEKIRDGAMTLGNSATLNAFGDEDAWSSNEDYHSIFSPVLDELDQAVDKDWVDAERDDREGDGGSDQCPL